MKYYHGTTSLFVPAIRQHGLRPASETGNCCENRRSNRDFVFLTDSISVATAHASRAVEKFGGEPRVLEIDAIARRRSSRRHSRFNQYEMLEFRRIRKVISTEPGVALLQEMKKICQRRN